MRADRLLSMLLLLQARGRMTARQLADALEVSERTIYRDVDALSAAGVPVYADRGPGGGVALLDDYRSELTGLTGDEIRALITFGSASPLDDLGLGDRLKAALIKLDAALPDARRAEYRSLGRRVYIDAGGWAHRLEPVPHLTTLYEAVRRDRWVRWTCRLMFGAQVTQRIAPYGLVAKAGVWYVVYAREGTLHVIEAAHVIAAEPTGEHFERPAGFDLAAFWAQWCATYEERAPVYPVRARIAPALLPVLRWRYGGAFETLLAEAGPPDAHGWREITLLFRSLEDARGQVLGFGRALEVLAPEALRLSVIDFARQIAAFYDECGSG